MLAVANRLKCEVHFATSALTKPSFQPLKILYIQQAHDQLLRLELDRDQLGQAIAQREQILTILHQVAGYKYFSLDLEGFHSGSMDKTLDEQTIASQKAQQKLNPNPAIQHQEV